METIITKSYQGVQTRLLLPKVKDVAGVIGDNNSTRLCFKLPRVYATGWTKFIEFDCYVYREGQGEIQPTYSLDKNDSFLIPYEITSAYSGKEVEYNLKFVSIDGTVTEKSEMATLYFRDSTEGIITEPEPQVDVVTYLYNHAHCKVSYNDGTQEGTSETVLPTLTFTPMNEENGEIDSVTLNVPYLDENGHILNHFINKEIVVEVYKISTPDELTALTNAQVPDMALLSEGEDQTKPYYMNLYILTGTDPTDANNWYLIHTDNPTFKKVEVESLDVDEASVSELSADSLTATSISTNSLTITDSDLSEKVLVTDSDGKVTTDSSLSLDELHALDGVTGNIQDQINAKAPTNHASTNTTYGVGSTTEYGHVKVDSAASTTSTNPIQNKAITNFVNSSINAYAAFYITKDANGSPFATYSELANAIIFYCGGAERVPTRNDYAIVVADEVHGGNSTRYIYNNQWEYQYSFNYQFTDAQWNAINSGLSSSDGDKLNTIQEGAEVNVQADWNESNDTSDAFIKNKPSINDGTLTINQNGASKGTFSANQSFGTTIDLTDTTYNVATTSADGLMSKEDKTKLNGIATGAQVNTITGVKGDAESSYRTGNVNITKANIGLGNVVNTGDSATPVQDGTNKFTTGGAYTELAKKVDKTTKVNNHALSGNVTVSKGDVGLGSVVNVGMDDTPTANSSKYVKSGGVKSALDGKVTANAAITGATKCKITYDSKGLVTKGEGLTEGDIPTLSISKTNGLQDSLDAKYVKPTGGIPKTDLASAVQESLGKADTAVQPQTTLAGYNIADAYISNGTITLGSNSITPISADALKSVNGESLVKSGSSTNVSVGTVTTTGTMTANHVVTSNGGTVIKDSGFTIGKSVPSDAKFTDTTYSAGNGLSLSNGAFSLKTGYTSSGKNYKVQLDSNGNPYVNVPWTDTDTKVTAVGNHYTPAEDTSAVLSADASSTTAATWNSTSLVTGVDLKRDAKGHVVGIAVDSIKMPANPNSDTKVRQTTLSGSDNVNRAMILAYNVNTTTGNTDNITYRSTKIYANDSTGTVTATKFVGNVTGNCSGSAGSVAWDNITGKPSSYPPTSHKHDSISQDTTSVEILGDDTILGSISNNPVMMLTENELFFITGNSGNYLDLDSDSNTTKLGAGGGAAELVLTSNGEMLFNNNAVILEGDERLTDARTPTAHNQASNTINAMTGYSKASSANAITTSDTLNGAIGKLEKALDSKVDTSRKVNGHALTSDVTVTKSDLGLGNVDNTSDANKPISNAVQTALNGKANTFSVTNSNPTLALGTMSKVATVAGTDIHVTMPANLAHVATKSTGTTSTTTAGVTYGVAAVTTSSQQIAAKWIAKLNSGVTALSDGMMISIKVPVAGNGTYGTVLSIDGGTKFHPVCRAVNSMISTRYAVNAIITLVYNSVQAGTAYGINTDGTPGVAGTSKSVTGIWVVVNDTDNDTNTKVTQTVSTTDSYYPLLACATANAASTTTTTSVFGIGVRLNPSKSRIALKEMVLENILGTSTTFAQENNGLSIQSSTGNIGFYTKDTNLGGVSLNLIKETSTSPPAITMYTLNGSGSVRSSLSFQPTALVTDVKIAAPSGSVASGDLNLVSGDRVYNAINNENLTAWSTVIGVLNGTQGQLFAKRIGYKKWEISGSIHIEYNNNTTGFAITSVASLSSIFNKSFKVPSSSYISGTWLAPNKSYSGDPGASLAGYASVIVVFPTSHNIAGAIEFGRVYVMDGTPGSWPLAVFSNEPITFWGLILEEA